MCKQIEEKEIKVLVQERKKTFKCPLCEKTLRVPKNFTSCSCGRWEKTATEEIREKWQTMSWGCTNVGECTYMRLQKKPTVNKSFFMKAFIEAHNIPFPQEMIPEKSVVKQ